MSLHCDWLIQNVSLATFADTGRPYGAVERGALAVSGDVIAWAGPESALPECDPGEVIDGEGQWLTPGLIDCHTHLVHGGNRAREFELRLEGATYEQIAREGGGILSTVRDTRAASEEVLFASASGRLRRLLAEGVTTVEIKSGYGLDRDTEQRMLRVARRLQQNLPVTVVTTYLGAHALPPEYADRADDYIRLVCDEVMPAVAAAGLADAVDVFCEGVGFTPAQCRRVFEAARSLGLPIKAHVEQLSDLGGAALAAEFGALSVDHLEYLNEDAIPALAAAGTTAVLLPGAFYCLRETQLPPVAALRSAGVPMAVATDLNPGSSPMASLLLAVNQACTLFRLTPEEALAGVTRHAAQALGCHDRGQLLSGLRADLALWPVERPAELAYGINFHAPSAVWQGGVRA